MFKNKKDVERQIRNVFPNIIILDEYYGVAKKARVKCIIHGCEWYVMPRKLLRENALGCPICSGLSRTIIKGYNDIATTHPHIAKWVKDKSLAEKYSIGSSKKIELICPDCNCEFNKIIRKLEYFPLYCPACGDGVPFPEKILYNLLDSLNVGFSIHKKFDWSNERLYDFYIDSLNTIIETHGIQHYEESNRGRSLKEEQENDVFKKEMAINNGISNYIVIDCRYSSIDFIKQNITDSELSYLFCLNLIDWNYINKLSSKSIVYKACELWGKGSTAFEIANILKHDKMTIIRYLKIGNDIGLCTYNPKEEMRKRGRRAADGNCIKCVCITTKEVFNSINDGCKKYSVYSGNVSKCCKGERESTGRHPITNEPLIWQYYDEILHCEYKYVAA